MRRKTYKQSAEAGITCLALLLGPGLAVNVSAALDGGDKIQGAKSPRGEANSALLSQVHLGPQGYRGRFRQDARTWLQHRAVRHGLAVV